MVIELDLQAVVFFLESHHLLVVLLEALLLLDKVAINFLDAESQSQDLVFQLVLKLFLGQKVMLELFFLLKLGIKILIFLLALSIFLKITTTFPHLLRLPHRFTLIPIKILLDFIVSLGLRSH